MSSIRDEFNKDCVQIKTDIKMKNNFQRIFSQIKTIIAPQNNINYPECGIGQISENLYQHILNKGVSFEFNNTISKIEQINQKQKKITLSDQKTFKCNNIIWTGQLQDLTGILNIEWPIDLKYISTVILLIVFPRRQRTKSKVLFEYFPDPDIIFQRLYYTDFFSERGDEYGICLEISENERIRNMSKVEILDKAIDGLKKTQRINSENILAYKLVNLNNSHPIYLLNYHDVLENIFGKIYQFKGIFPVGRQGSFHNIQMRDAIKHGLRIGEYCSNV